MRHYTSGDCKYVVYDFTCPYCSKETTITVHDDGVSVCNSCNSETLPPIPYEQAAEQCTEGS